MLFQRKSNRNWNCLYPKKKTRKICEKELRKYFFFSFSHSNYARDEQNFFSFFFAGNALGEHENCYCETIALSFKRRLKMQSQVINRKKFFYLCHKIFRERNYSKILFLREERKFSIFLSPLHFHYHKILSF